MSKFKWGDKIRVRENDFEEWQEALFIEKKKNGCRAIIKGYEVEQAFQQCMSEEEYQKIKKITKSIDEAVLTGTWSDKLRKPDSSGFYDIAEGYHNSDDVIRKLNLNQKIIIEQIKDLSKARYDINMRLGDIEYKRGRIAKTEVKDLNKKISNLSDRLLGISDRLMALEEKIDE